MRILLMGDWSGRSNRGLLEPGAGIADRPVVALDVDDFDDVMYRFSPRLELPLAEAASAGTPVEFRTLDDFHPDELYGKLELYGALRDTRRRLLDPATFAQAAAEVGRETIVFKQPTGNYLRNVTTTNRIDTTRVHVDNVVYGPWIEGTSRRNDETRFKGYRIFRKAAQAVDNRVGEIVADEIRGHEFVAEVVEVGEGVRGWKVGDRAVPISYTSNYGCWADYFLCPPVGVQKVPGNVPDEEAVFVEALHTGFGAVEAADLKPGWPLAEKGWYR